MHAILLRVQIETIDEDLALRWFYQAGQHVEQGSFTRTACAHDPDKFSWPLCYEYVSQANAAVGKFQFCDGSVKRKFSGFYFFIKIGYQVAVIQCIARLGFDGAAVREQVNAIHLHSKSV